MALQNSNGDKISGSVKYMWGTKIVLLISETVQDKPIVTMDHK